MVEDIKHLEYGGKKVTKCFRLPSQAIDELVLEAKRKEISLNSLMNGLIMSYLKWGRFLERHGGLSFSENSFSSLIREIDDISIFERAGLEAGLRTPRRLLLMLGLPTNKETVLRLLDVICEYSMSYRYSHRLIENKHNFLLTHNLGRKMSRWFSAYVKSMFKELLNLNIDIREDDDSVTFTV
jgi:hypothetical protein